MSKKEETKPMNFKRLWDKKYADLVGTTMSNQSKYTPDQVMALVVKYFEWAEENSIKASETTAFQGRVYEDEVNKFRVFTHTGLQLFTSFSNQQWLRWRKEPGYDVVCEFADSVIREQKYQLAVNGIINPGMVSKDLGIDKGDQINVSANAEAGASTSIDNVSKEEIKEAVKDILSEI